MPELNSHEECDRELQEGRQEDVVHAADGPAVQGLEHAEADAGRSREHRPRHRYPAAACFDAAVEPPKYSLTIAAIMASVVPTLSAEKMNGSAEGRRSLRNKSH